MRGCPQRKSSSLFEAAKKAQLAKHYADASASFKALLQDLPGDALLTKWSADAALELGDSAYALGVLKPVVMSNFADEADLDDWCEPRQSQVRNRRSRGMPRWSRWEWSSNTG